MDDQSTPSTTPPHHPAGFYFVIAVFFSLLLGVNSYLAWQHGQATLGASTEKEPAKAVLPSPLPTWPASYPSCFRKEPTPTIPFLSAKIEPTLKELAAKCPVFMVSKYRNLKPDTIEIGSDRFQIYQVGLMHKIYEAKPAYEFVASPPAKLFTKTFTTDIPVPVSIDSLNTKGIVLSIRSCTLAVDTSCKEFEKGMLVLLPNGTWLELTGDYISTVLTKNFPVDFPIDITYLKP